MNPKSASSLAWLSAIVLVIGMMVMSPAGQMAAYVLAAVLAAFPAALGPRKARIGAIVVAVLALVLLAAAYWKG